MHLQKKTISILSFIGFTVVTVFLFQNCNGSGVSFKTLDYNSLTSSSFLSTDISSDNDNRQVANDQAANSNNGGSHVSSPLVGTPPVSAIPSLSSEFKFLSFLGDGLTKGIGDIDLIDDSKNYSNTFFIKDDDLEKVVEKLRRAALLKKKTIIMLEDIIFDWKSGKPVEIQSNYLASIEQLFHLISSSGLLDTVIGFYVIDEPYLKNMSATRKLTQQAVYQNLKNVGLSIKNIFKNKKLLVAEGYPVLDEFFKNGIWPGFPSEYDYVGLSCYIHFSGVCDTESSYRKYIQGIYSKLDKSSGQKIFIVLDNYWGVPLADQKKQIQDRLIERVKLQFQLASEYNSAGLVSFLYQSINSESLVGLNDMIYLKSVTTKLSANYLEYPFCQSGSGAVFYPRNCILNLTVSTTCTPSTANSGDSIECNANIKLNSAASVAYKQIEWEVEYDNHRIEPVPDCTNKSKCSWNQVPAGRYIVRAKVISLTGLMSWSDAVVTVNEKKLSVTVTTTCSPDFPKNGDTVICTSAINSESFKNIDWEVQYDNGKTEATGYCANQKVCSWLKVPSGKYIVRTKVRHLNDELSWSDVIVDVK
ncbi:MAG: hypothetical protein JNL11_16625 [Bdellovibrionaceae bacterium]|nr:hypothetical protein [Pseudobdellovibrionaceae bacterium]